LKKTYGNHTGNSESPVQFIFSLDPEALPFAVEPMKSAISTVKYNKEAYVILSTEIEDKQSVLITGNSEKALWHGMVTIMQLIERADAEIRFPKVDIIDYPKMKTRSLLADVGGQGFMIGPSYWEYHQWQELVDWMVDYKYNELWLEFIGSGRLMGNLDMAKGEWIGWPLDLKSYPELVAKDRPMKRWDAEKQKLVEDRYTAPNVRKEFVRKLIDYAQERGIDCQLFIGYDYFANQMPYVMGIPANDPSHPEANKVYDSILSEIVEFETLMISVL